MSRTNRLERRLLSADPRVVDSLIAGALAIATATLVGLQGRPTLLELLAGLVMSATVGVRRRKPVGAFVIAVVSATLASHSGGAHLPVAAVVLGLNSYAIGRREAHHARGLLDALLTLASLAAIATNPGTPSPRTPLVIAAASVWGFFVGLPYVAGRMLGIRTRMNAALRADAERLEYEQRERARQAIISERTRIARELHDVVAHSVSVMVIQTQAARRVAARDRAAAAEALRAVESCGREALVDMRRMMGVLHRGDIDLLGGAAPGLAQLSKLVDRAHASGLPVDIAIEGGQRPLSPALDLVAFRVVQEALTNAIKHAGPARASVKVTFAEDSLELAITDTGTATGMQTRSSGAPVGHGLVGMQERVTLYGGQLNAGPCRGGGFSVFARIPLSEPALTR